MNRKQVAFLALIFSVAPSLATANLLIDDGLDHLVTGAISETVTMSNGSNLHVTTGGSIIGNGTSVGPLFAGGALEVDIPGPSHIRLDGDAIVSGGADRFAIARMYMGDLHIADNSVVNAGTSSYAIFGIGWSSFPQPPLLKTFLTERAFINGSVRTDGLVSISDNAVINGKLEESHSGIDLEMNGGLITGRVRTGSLVGHSAIIHSGSILGGYGGNASNIDFSMRGGRIAGGWFVNSREMDVEVHGGRIDGGMSFGEMADPFAHHSSINIFGGAFDATPGRWLLNFTSGLDFEGRTDFDCSSTDTIFNIWGGQFGYTASGSGLHLDLCATIDIYGTNLSYSGGMLHGFLADGSLLNLAVTEESRWSGQLRLHDVSVPEPGTLGLLGLALAAMVVAPRSATGGRSHTAH